MSDPALFQTSSGNTVTVALDHGLSLGAVDGFRDPAETLGRVADGDPDSVLVGPHFARRYREELESADVDVAVTADVVAFSTRPGQQEAQDVWEPAFDYELIRDLDPVAVKMVLVFGRSDRRLFQRNVGAVAEMAERLRGADTSFVVEPVMWGERIPEPAQTDPDYVEKAARMGWEYGADALKVPFTGDRETFEPIARNMPVPVTILGGPASGTTRAMLEDVEAAMAAGARGLVMGRSIWKADDPARVIGALNGIVHEEKSVDEVW
jgi:DhnA family fructose-bisphosphate aldolase class Ia